MLRSGFQAVKVWQFWQGIFRLPWGLRVEGRWAVCADASPAGTITRTANNPEHSLRHMASTGPGQRVSE